MGYFALCPNPRGSYGQGESFTQGNVKDFGAGDYRDIMAGVDALIKQYPIDPKRIGIRGHSYGGYMTMWAETQTNRFTAAVAGAAACSAAPAGAARTTPGPSNFAGCEVAAIAGWPPLRLAASVGLTVTVLNWDDACAQPFVLLFPA